MMRKGRVSPESDGSASETGGDAAPQSSAAAGVADARQTLGSLLTDSILFGVARLASALASIILVPIYTRRLSVSEYGVVENLNILLNLVAGVFALALPEALFRFLPIASSKSDRRTLIATCSILSLVSGALGTLICLTFADGLAARLLPQVHEQGRALVTICGILAFITIQFALIQATLRITLRRAAYVVSTLGAFLLSLCCAVVCVVGLHLGALGVFLGPAVGMGLAYVISVARTPAIFSVAAFDLDLGRKLLRFSVPLVPVSLFLFVIRSSDRYFITALMPNALQQVGLYATAEKILAPLTLATAGFALAWPPFAMHAARQENATRLYRAAFGYYVGLTSLGIVALAAAARVIVRVFTPPAYHQSYLYVPVVGLYIALGTLHYVGSVGLVLSDRTRLGVPPLAIAAGLNLMLNFVLIPRYGVFGATSATAASFLMYDILMFQVAERQYHIGFPLWRGLGAYAASLAAAFLALGRPVAGAGILAVQAIVVVVLGLVDKREMKALWALFARVVGRG